ncbi:MAG: hypothetical protein COB12_00240 [Flavobacterium sp.]|nr:MAG: hypothetical protein COB12_00240 [Flavobacterium sp.]
MNNKSQQIPTPKQFIKTINIMYYAILLGPIGFLLVQYFDIKETKLEFTNTENPLQYVVPILAILGFLFGKHLFNQNIKKLQKKETLLEKLSLFQTGFIIKIALLEGPSLLGIVAFSQEGNLFFLFISGILLLIIALKKPNKLNIEALLNLSSEQRSQFNKPDEKLV